MAPEIVTDQPYDEKVDIWATGVITHILLTGFPPFCGRSKAEIYKSVSKEDPSWGNRRDKDYSYDLTPEAIQFVNKCLKKDPSMRSSAEVLLNHPWLQEAGEGEEAAHQEGGEEIV